MQFVRTIIDSDRLENVFDIPREFKHQKVEVLILPLPGKKKKKLFNPGDFEGILDAAPGEIEQEINTMRDDWERI